MALGAIVGAALTTPGAAAPRLWIDGTNVLTGSAGAGVDVSGVTISSGLDDTAGELTATFGDPALAYTLPARATVMLYDGATDTILYSGRLTARDVVPDFGQQGRSTQLRATDWSERLDGSYVTAIYYPSGLTDQAMVQSLCGIFGRGELVTFPYVLNTATMPAMAFGGQSLRSAIEQVAIQAAGDLTGQRHYYVDPQKRLHYFLTESNAAPKNLNSVVSGTEIAPSDLSISYDDSAIRTAVLVRGGTAAGSGYVVNGAAVALYGWVADQLDAPDSITAAQKAAYGNGYLAPRSVPVVRGSFTVDQSSGWAAGQTILVTNTALGLAARSFYLTAVEREFVSGGYSRYRVAFGARPRSLLRQVGRN